MRWIIEWSLRFQLLVIALAFLIVLTCLIQVQRMPVDALPEFAPPYIDIQTETPGLSTPEVEELVTFNLEELLNGTPWLQSIRSISVPGLSAITLTFQPGTDILRARQLVSERLGLAYTLPNVAEAPVILQPLSTMSRVMMIGLSSQNISPIDLSVLAYWNIRPALLSVPGVANVAIWGLRYKQLQVEVDSKLLQAQNIRLDQIVATTGNALWVSPLSYLNASTPGSDGWIETPQQRIELRHVLPIFGPKELALINIENSKLTLGDVSKITTGYPPLIGEDVIGNDVGLLVLIDKFPGANTLDVTRKIEEKLTELQPALSGVNVDTTFFRPAGFVETIINNVSMTLLIGFLLLLFTLSIFTRSWRAVLACLITIGVTFCAAILVLNLLGITINVVILAGLIMAIVVIIDEVIVDVDRLFLTHGYSETRSISDYLLAITLKNRGGLFYATIIILLTLLPIYFLNGFNHYFFQPLVMAYAVSVIVAMLVAWLIAPAIYLSLIQSQVPTHYNLSDNAQGYYQLILNKLTNVASDVLVAICVTLALLTFFTLVFYLSFRNVALLPQFKEQDVLVQWEGPPSTSIGEMVRITKRVTRELRAIPGVQHVAVDIGRAVLGDKVVNVNSAQLIVRLDPRAHYEETLKHIRNIVAGYPGMLHSVQTYLEDRTKHVALGKTSDIVVRLYGHQYDILRKKAEEVRNVVTKVKGAVNVRIDEQIDQPEIAVEVNLTKAQQFGLKPGDVRRATATLIAGLQVGDLFDEQKIFPVVVWGKSEDRHSINSLQNLLIDTPSGKWVRLDEVADVSIKPSPNYIQHETISKLLDIDLDVSGRNGAAVAEDIREQLKRIHFPLEYRVEVLGAYQQYLFAKERFILIIIAVTVLILLLLQSIFESFTLALLVLFTAPLALLGSVIIALLIHSMTTIALIGMLAVFAITIRNTIVSLTYFETINQLGQTNKDVLLTAASARFRPILIVMCATIFLMIPFVFLFSRPGLEIVAPIAAIIIGGIITSTIYTGLIVPALYFIWANKGRD